MASNLANGSRFEREMAKRLSDDGFWVLRIPQNAGGQQPADLIVIKGRYHALIDCKVVSVSRFPFDRIEDNQHYAMEKFQQIGGEVGWFAIQLPDGEVRMMDLEMIRKLEDIGKHSLSERELMDIQYTWSLDEWRERVIDLCE